jgi:hypothetical protein
MVNTAKVIHTGLEVPNPELFPCDEKFVPAQNHNHRIMELIQGLAQEKF